MWYYWEFGDGMTLCGPDEATPIHNYPDAGTYTVTLTTVNTTGCIEIVSTDITIVCDGCERTKARFRYQCLDCTENFVFVYDEQTGTWSELLLGYDCEFDFTDMSGTAPSEFVIHWTWTVDGEVVSNLSNPQITLEAPPIGNQTIEVRNNWFIRKSLFDSD